EQVGKSKTISVGVLGIILLSGALAQAQAGRSPANLRRTVRDRSNVAPFLFLRLIVEGEPIVELSLARARVDPPVVRAAIAVVTCTGIARIRRSIFSRRF